MNSLVPIALYGWIPFVALLFCVLRPSRAVITAYLAGWMFLPVASVELFGFFDYSKDTAVPSIVFACVLVFDAQRARSLRFSLFDLPIAIFCAAPFASSIANDLGVYDGLSALVHQTIIWGLPYLTGRIYFSSPEGLRRLALGVFAGGLIYAPLCLWEIRMSPQLHAIVYGFHQHDWTQTLRFGGYRPMVFMNHGLMVGLWMSAASIIGVALWISGGTRKFWGIPLSIAVPALIATTLLCKSSGAIALLAAAIAVLVLMKSFATSLPMALLVCVPTGYVALRTVGEWSGSGLTEVVDEFSSERANSLSFRFRAEERLREKAAERPLLGWGGWGRSFVRNSEDPERTDTVITDSLWILVFGKYGALGLASLLALFCAPVVALWRRCPPRAWSSPNAVLPWALATVLSIYALDSLVNAMENPVYVLIAGGLCGLAPRRELSTTVAPATRARSRASIHAVSP